MTRRDAALPEIPKKFHAVTGMRRAGKTTFLQQLAAESRRGAAPERALHLSFDDDRLADIAAEQLSALLEEFYRRPEPTGILEPISKCAVRGQRPRNLLSSLFQQQIPRCARNDVLGDRHFETGS